MRFDPGTLGQLQEQRLVQSPAVAEVDILHTGALAQLGFFKPRGELVIFPGGDLPVDQKSQALFEAELVQIEGVHMFLQREQHAQKTQLGEFFKQGMSQHWFFVLSGR